MDTKALLEQLLQAGKDIASKGRQVAADKIGIPDGDEERSAMLSGLGKGAVAGGLLAMLVGTRSGRKITKGALKYGSLAALGGVAYTAFRNWQESSKADELEPLDAGDPIDRLEPSSAENRSMQIVRAMIAAAKADGHIDADERARFTEQIQQMGLDESTRSMLHAELDKPLDAMDVASGVDSLAAASEIYLASLMVIDVDNDKERAYLRTLAQALNLSPDFVDKIEGEAFTDA